MSDDMKLAVMPDNDTMFAALRGVFDDPHACERLYPKICRSLAGQEKFAIGVVLGLQLAIQEYAMGMPPSLAGTITPFVPDFIQAITPEVIRTDALKAWAMTDPGQPDHVRDAFGGHGPTSIS